ncbi:MAG: hypothetical protein ACPGO5_04495 [Patescibacteria group bacterium]
MGIFKKYFGNNQIKTGSDFKQSAGYDSLHNLLRRAKANAPSTLGNVSYEELDKFEKLIAGTARRLPTGAGFNKYTKYRLKRKVDRLYRKHSISNEDRKDFYDIIDAL